MERFLARGMLKLTREGVVKLLSEIKHLKTCTSAALPSIAPNPGPSPSYARWHNILQLLAEPIAPNNSKISAINP